MILYITTNLILLFVIFILNIKCLKSDYTLKKILNYLTIATIIIVISNILSINVQTEQTAVIYNSIYHIGLDALITILLYFTQYNTLYNKIYENITNKKLKNTIYVVISLCTLNLCTDILFISSNVITKNVFEIHHKIYNGIILNEFVMKAPFCYIHYIYIYYTIFVILNILLYKYKQSSVIYKKQYIITFTCVMIVCIINVLNYIFNPVFNFSLYSFEFLNIFLIYYIICVLPNTNIKNVTNHLINSSNIGVLYFDDRLECIYINATAKNIFNNISTNIGNVFLNLINFTKIENNYTDIVNNICINNKEYDITITNIEDKYKKNMGVYFQLIDKTETNNLIKQELYEAAHDKLTDLLKKETFYNEVENIIKYNNSTNYYILYINVKDFKLINELFGLKKGDEVLINLSEILKNYQYSAICGRLENDHFAMCIKKMHFNEEEFVEQIQKLNAIVFSQVYHIHVDIGIYETRGLQIAAPLMCDRANMAIKQNQTNERINIAYYTEAVMNELIKEQTMVNEFEYALNNEQFCIFLQPQIDNKGNLLGAEALVRWKRPDIGLISPMYFIPIFEKTGLIYKLDVHVWELACKQLKKWKEKNIDKYISVNISPKDFYYLDVYKIFTELIEKYDIDAKKLKLEITETAIMENARKNIQLLHKLRNYGFAIEIDDFGSGYSSLNMLKDIEADILKIDMAFLNKTNNTKRSEIILTSIVEMSKKLNMPVVIEGVETKEQLDYLNTLGCDVYQGYYFAKPMDVYTFEKRYFKEGL